MAQDTQNKKEEEAFPWHLGVYDAHCHPTDTMSSIPSLPSMKTRALTVMSTRAQDQELVSGVAEKYGVKSKDPEKWTKEECMVPCFGWHPWFSYQMYVSEDEGKGEVLKGEEKIRHYQNVLRPKREDPSDEDLRIFESLPDPKPFSTFLHQTRQYLEKHPYALVGEIGLDRSFRIPEAWLPSTQQERNDGLTPGGREGRRLTPFRVDMAHQKKIVKMQLQLAAEMGRGVSVHGVQAHGVVFDVLKELWSGHERTVPSKRQLKKQKEERKEREHMNDEEEAHDTEDGPKPYPPRICLHSYSGNPDAFKQYLDPKIPVQIFASFSTAINLSDSLDVETPEEFVEMIQTVPDHMLLVESDLHTAGERMDKRIKDIVRRLCLIKGWGLEEGVKILGENWRAFVFGEGAKTDQKHES